jgi:predicted P-loop ATPase
MLNHVFDPVRDYLDGLRWDGVSRVDRWLIDYCGAEDTPLNRAFGRKVLMAGVRRVRQPGCKFDYILTLEGDQGIGKSTMLRILAGGEENFTDSEILGLDKQEQQEAIWVVSALRIPSSSEIS